MFFRGSRPAFACSQAARSSGNRHSRLPARAQVCSAFRKSPLKLLSISMQKPPPAASTPTIPSGQTEGAVVGMERSEEHTSELQSPCNLVCRLLLEKKKKKQEQLESED